MAINLQALLQAVNAGGNIPGLPTPGQGTPIVPPVQGEDITVTAPQSVNPQQVPAVLQQSLEPLQATPEQLQKMAPLEGLPAHKGIFGIKGTLRDVLGTLGDALLVGSGNKAIYQPGRQQEKVSDALVGYGPGKEADAIARVMQVNPEMGMKLYQDWQGRLNDQAKIDAQIEVARTGTRSKQSANQIQKIKVAQQWAANTKDPAVLASIKNWIQDPDATLDDIPDNLLGLAATTPYQRELVRQGDARIGISQQQADAATTRASRAPAGRVAPQPTAASIAAPILSKVAAGKPISAGEQETLNRLGMNPERGRGGGRRRPAPSGNKQAPSSTGGWGKMTVK